MRFDAPLIPARLLKRYKRFLTDVELANGELLTVWYEKMKEHPKAILRQARWTL